MKIEETFFISDFDNGLQNFHSEAVEALSLSGITYVYSTPLSDFCLKFNIKEIKFELTQNKFLIFPFKNKRIYLTTNGIPKNPFVSIISYHNHPIYIIHEKNDTPSTILMYRNPQIDESDYKYVNIL